LPNPSKWLLLTWCKRKISSGRYIYLSTASRIRETAGRLQKLSPNQSRDDYEFETTPWPLSSDVRCANVRKSALSLTIKPLLLFPLIATLLCSYFSLFLAIFYLSLSLSPILSFEFKKLHTDSLPHFPLFPLFSPKTQTQCVVLHACVCESGEREKREREEEKERFGVHLKESATGSAPLQRKGERERERGGREWEWEWGFDLKKKVEGGVPAWAWARVTLFFPPPAPSTLLSRRSELVKGGGGTVKTKSASLSRRGSFFPPKKSRKTTTTLFSRFISVALILPSRSRAVCTPPGPPIPSPRVPAAFSDTFCAKSLFIQDFFFKCFSFGFYAWACMHA
jgi:hypothetical protein